MSYLPKDFLYMPPGSYAVLPDGGILFLEEIPDDLKERFLKDYEQKQKERRENPDFLRFE